jgi:hypothetical protein
VTSLLTVTLIDELGVLQIVSATEVAFFPSLNVASFGLGGKSTLLRAAKSKCVL